MSKTFLVRKRDGHIEPWVEDKLETTVGKAFRLTQHHNGQELRRLVSRITRIIHTRFSEGVVSSEEIPSVVEEVLVGQGYVETASAYLLYIREPKKRLRVREYFGIPDDLHLGMNALWLLQERYFLRDKNGAVAETPRQLFHRVAKTIAQGERHYEGTPQDIERWTTWFEDLLENRVFFPNSPTLMNAGVKNAQLSACFVLPLEDSIAGIFDTLSCAARIQQTGGGTGFDFSSLRPQGDLIHTTGGQASGPVSFIELFHHATEVMKRGGKRSGANMAVLRFDHPDIETFIASKRDPRHLTNFNVSVGVTDSFMRAVRLGTSITLRHPRTGKTTKKISARKLFEQIVHAAWETGDPGLLFLDEINRKNTTRHLGEITATNPCGEQPLHPWEACTLGSINLTKVLKGIPTKGDVDWGLLRQTIHSAVRFLDNAIDKSHYPDARIAKMVQGNRRIGLGVMGFAEYLIHLGIPYASAQALKEAKRLAAFLQDEAHRASEQLARDRGNFPFYKGSEWDKRGIPMRHAAVTTIAPTGSISLIAGCSSGIEPLFAVGFVRETGQGVHLFEISPSFEAIARQEGFWSSKLFHKILQTGSVQGVHGIPSSIQALFRTAHEIPVSQHIRMQAVFQSSIDHAVSKTVNLPARAKESDVREAFLLAWKLHCKGVTIYRQDSKPRQTLQKGIVVGGKQAHPLLVKHAGYTGSCSNGTCLSS